MRLMLVALLGLTTATAAFAAPNAEDYQAEMDRMGALIELLPADAAQALVMAYSECLVINPVEWSACAPIMDDAAAKAGIVEARS